MYFRAVQRAEGEGNCTRSTQFSGKILLTNAIRFFRNQKCYYSVCVCVCLAFSFHVHSFSPPPPPPTVPVAPPFLLLLAFAGKPNQISNVMDHSTHGTRTFRQNSKLCFEFDDWWCCERRAWFHQIKFHNQLVLRSGETHTSKSC